MALFHPVRLLFSDIHQLSTEQENQNFVGKCNLEIEWAKVLLHHRAKSQKVIIS